MTEPFYDDKDKRDLAEALSGLTPKKANSCLYSLAWFFIIIVFSAAVILAGIQIMNMMN